MGRETERKGDGTRVDGEREFVIHVQLFFRSFRMRVARLLLCCVLLEDYSTNLGGTAITSDAMRQDGSSSATNPTLSGTYPYILICILPAGFSFPRSSASHRGEIAQTEILVGVNGTCRGMRASKYPVLPSEK